MSNSNNRGSSGGENKRRYFRRRPPATKAQEPPPPQKEPNSRRRNGDKSGQLERSERSLRMARRRRRSRSKADSTVNPKAEPAVESILEMGDYTPPTSVFIYTYISRPADRDSYEFRSEHFSKVGRRLEDYDIDLSQLYADDYRAEAERAETE